MIKIGTFDITSKIKYGGISESLEAVAAEDNTEIRKGAYSVSSLSLGCLTDAEKAEIEQYALSSSVEFAVDDDAVTVAIESCSSTLTTEQSDFSLWDMSLSVKTRNSI
jgi:hypothetical protein|nr:MAG TPA: hypothetical protein [Caudoviricetes sp.]